MLLHTDSQICPNALRVSLYLCIDNVNRCCILCRDALLISVLDTLTSLLAGVVIFSVLGAMSKELALPIDQVATGGKSFHYLKKTVIVL